LRAGSGEPYILPGMQTQNLARMRYREWSDEQRQWLERFREVSRAQSKYLFLLMLAGIFLLAQYAQVVSPSNGSGDPQIVAVEGIKLNPLILWAAGPIVLGLLLRATLGTLDALSVAHQHLAAGVDSVRAFERIDTAPNALDFIVYRIKPQKGRLAPSYLIYPLSITLAYIEGWYLLREYVRSAFVAPGDKPLLVLGGLSLLWCTPRLAKLWWQKGRRMLEPRS